MMKRMSCFFNILLAVIIMSIVGCRAEKTTNTDNVEIYQLLIRNVYLGDNNFHKPLDIQYLYILKDTDDGIGDSQITKQPSQQVPDEVMDELSIKLSDLPSKIIWINTSNEVLSNDNGSLTVEDGAIITLGNIRYENGTKAYVSISIYFANLSASGRTYILEKDKGTWKIIGDTGGGWVS